MAWYIWLLIGLWAGATAALFSPVFSMAPREQIKGQPCLGGMVERGMRNMELQENPKKYSLEEEGI